MKDNEKVFIYLSQETIEKIKDEYKNYEKDNTDFLVAHTYNINNIIVTIYRDSSVLFENMGANELAHYWIEKSTYFNTDLCNYIANDVIPILPKYATINNEVAKKDAVLQSILNQINDKVVYYGNDNIIEPITILNDNNIKEKLIEIYKRLLNPYKFYPITKKDNNVKYFMKIKSEWLINNRVDVKKFAELYLSNRDMCYHLDNFYDINGVVSIMNLKNDIINILGETLKKENINRTAKEIIDIMKAKCKINNTNENVIHVNNAKLTIKNGKIFVSPKELSINRLNINYVPWLGATPKRFLTYLNELLTEDEIQVLQEFMGYILIPTLRAEKSLIIIGKGGEGKSVLLNIIKNILGNSIIEKQFTKLLSDKFGFTNIEGKLAFCDDDMPKIEKKYINLFKKLVTLDEISLEKKNEHEQIVQHYARFIGLGNCIFTNNELNDEALVRRLIILEAKLKQKDRIYNRNLLSELLREKEEIFNWMLEGLIRLMNNGFNFSYSDEMENIVKDILNSSNDNYIHNFIKSDYVKLCDDGKETTQDLYNVYIEYTKKLEIKDIASMEKFSRDLARVANFYNIKGGYTLTDDNGERHKGYIGIRIVKK